VRSFPVIKASATVGSEIVRPIPSGGNIQAGTQHSEPVPPLIQQIDTLQAVLDDKQKQIEAHPGELEKAYEKGLLQGRADGLLEAQTREESRLDALRRGVEVANEALSHQLQGIEALALLLAQDCFEKVIANPCWRADVVTELIRAQMMQIEESMAVAIEVSSLDFPDQAALDNLCSGLGLRSLAVVTDSSLDSGDCKMTLRLGQLDIGLNRQLQAVNELIERTALSGGASQ
jgi:flagellar biosynthesis/type III secretory pathway protein FliH